MVLTENELVEKAKEMGIPLDKMCSKSPDGTHHLGGEWKEVPEGNMGFIGNLWPLTLECQFCKWCGKAIW